MGQRRTYGTFREAATRSQKLDSGNRYVLGVNPESGERFSGILRPDGSVRIIGFLGTFDWEQEGDPGDVRWEPVIYDDPAEPKEVWME